MTTLSILVTALRNAGYKVSTSPKNTLAKKELCIEIDSVDLEVETSVSYFLTYRLGIRFIEDDVPTILEQIPDIIEVSEGATYTTVRTTVVESPRIDPTDGTAYSVTIPFTYKEVINIG